MSARDAVNGNAAIAGYTCTLPAPFCVTVVLCTGPKGWKKDNCGAAAPTEMVDPFNESDAHPVAESDEVAGTLTETPLEFTVMVAFVAPVTVPASAEPLNLIPTEFS